MRLMFQAATQQLYSALLAAAPQRPEVEADADLDPSMGDAIRDAVATGARCRSSRCCGSSPSG